MRIANCRSWRTNSGGSRVEADIDGEPLWFDSDDAPLTPSPEGFASALLIAAATRGEPLEIDAAVDRSWLEQAGDRAASQTMVAAAGHARDRRRCCRHPARDAGTDRAML
ncbi:MAG TPA: hypothetical protein VIF65_05920 [Methyloceanibacter sp.]